MTGNADTHSKNRQRYRKKLRAQGFSEEVIEQRIADRRALQRAQREAVRTEPVWEQLDDSGYRPTRRDPITTGAARVTGIAARVARRGKTITRFQYDEAEKEASAQ